jgi:hypothetical protein
MKLDSQNIRIILLIIFIIILLFTVYSDIALSHYVDPVYGTHEHDCCGTPVFIISVVGTIFLLYLWKRRVKQ